jgi:hypothetical protein
MSVAHQTNYPDWTEAQWAKVTHLVSQEAQKARVAAQFLPLFGPVDPSLIAVPNLRLGDAPNPSYAPLRATNRLTVDSTPDVFLATIAVNVPLANHDVKDPELQAASVAFRRSAVTLARIEDAIIFNGQPGPSLPPLPTFPGGWLDKLPKVYTVHAGASQPGLLPKGVKAGQKPPSGSVSPRVGVAVTGSKLVAGINTAITSLEGTGHSGPFACYLGPDLFDAAHTPNGTSLVLPRDRIIPFLGGEYLRRSNTIPAGYGVLVALGGAPVEIVVASDIAARYLQQTPEPRFLFRISERIALRVKEWNAVAVLHP